MSILWIVDRGSPAEGLAVVPSVGAENLVYYVERTTAFAELNATISQQLRQAVRLIRIVSHGNAGTLLFSNGRISESNVQVLGFLRGLTGSRALGAGIEIHGCGVASDYLPPPRHEPGVGNVNISNYGNLQGELTPWGYNPPEVAGSSIIGTAASNAMRSTRGFRFLQRLAGVTGVGVKGGVDYQLPDTRWQYEGPTFTVYPDRSRAAELADPSNRLGFGQFVTF